MKNEYNYIHSNFFLITENFCDNFKYIRNINKWIIFKKNMLHK